MSTLSDVPARPIRTDGASVPTREVPDGRHEPIVGDSQRKEERRVWASSQKLTDEVVRRLRLRDQR